MHSSLFIWSYSAHPGYQKIIVERCESENVTCSVTCIVCLTGSTNAPFNVYLPGKIEDCMHIFAIYKTYHLSFSAANWLHNNFK